MTIQQFTDAVEIDGSQDIEQLTVKGHSTQTAPLQVWMDANEVVQAEVSNEGDFQVSGHLRAGDLDPTREALIEGHNLEDVNKPKRGLHTAGIVNGTLSAIVQWVVQELVLKGTGGISALHTALRVRLTNENTGTMDSGADLRAGDFEIINQDAVGGIAYGLKVKITDTGALDKAYAIHAEGGAAHFGDALELKVFDTTPADPPAGFQTVYLMVEDGEPKLYAKAQNEAPQVIAGGGGSAAPAQYRSGMSLSRLDDHTMLVDIGEAVVEAEMVVKSDPTQLDLETAANWIGGVANETASSFVNLYVNANGDLKLHNKLPHYMRPDQANRVFTGLVNQSGWTGESGFGFNATSVIYDGDTGEGNLTPGMLLAVYGDTDTDYSLGRGKRDGASASVDDLSFARILDVDVNNKTLTLEAGHQIAIYDNDRLIALPVGRPLYRLENDVWWRWLGALRNNAQGNLVSDQSDYRAQFYYSKGTNYSKSAGTVWVEVDEDFNLHLMTLGGDIELFIAATFYLYSGGSGRSLYVGFALDGAMTTNDVGVFRTSGVNNSPQISISQALTNVLPGTHKVSLMWRNASTAATTTRLYADDTFQRPQFYAREMR